MNSLAKPPRHIRVGRKMLFVLALLVAGLVANLALIPAAGASVQDLYTNAYSLTAALSTSPSSFSDTATNISSYTRDSIEVDGLSSCFYPSNPINTYSVWYSYTPPSNGWLTLSTLDPNTNFDTVVEVWNGPVASANSVGCNDDAIAGNRRSELTKQVVGGTNYIIAIRLRSAAAMPPTPQLGFAAAFTSVREVYVDQTNGSDGNTGSAALPFRTIGKAASALLPAGGGIRIVDPGVYNEAVTISAPTTLAVPSGAVSLTSLTLAANPVSSSGVFSANTVNVQPGGMIQNGVDLVATGGTVNVAPGTYTESIAIGKNLTLQGAGAPLPTIVPAAGPAVISLGGGSATISGFTINAGSSAGIVITGGSNHVIYRNNITSSTPFGVDNSGGVSGVNAAENYWNDPSGPGGAGPGTGTGVSTNVIYRPWCTTAAPTCLPRAGAATRLTFTTSPGSTAAGAAFAAQPVVRAEDDLGNLDTSFTGAVTLAIKGGTGTAGATIGGTVITLNAIAGVADFAGQGLNINFVGQSYQLTAISGALNSTPTDSTVFNITADRLVITASPANPSVAGAPLAVAVAAQDGAGHTDTTFVGTVSLAIQSNPTGATLQGTPSKSASSGVATFGGAGEANIQVVGIGYTLRASSGALAIADTSGFEIVASTADHLDWSQQPPASAQVNSTFTVKVRIVDQFGNTITNYSADTAQLSLIGGTVGAVLTGGGATAFTSGEASFNVSLDKIGSGYQLVPTLSSGTLPGANQNSSTFDIIAGSAHHLDFSQQPPASAQAGVAFAVKVKVVDQFGNLVTSYNADAAQLSLIGGTAGAVLTGGGATAFVSGEATFNVSVNKVGTGYQLVPALGATTLPGTNQNSSTFDITPNAAHHLDFSQQPPASAQANSTFSVKVKVVDQFGNLVTSYNADTAQLSLIGGTVGAVLTGGGATAFTSGEASFTVAVNRIGAAYQLVPALSATTLSGASQNSTTFNITADRLVITASPTNPSTAGAPLNVVVEAHDGFGTLDTSFTGMVGLALQSNPTGATLQGTPSKAAVAGVATFGGVGEANIQVVGIGYTLRASSGTLLTDDTAGFAIVAGAAHHLDFSQQPPASSQAGVAFAVKVKVVDQFGNLVTSYNADTAQLSLIGGTAGAVLTGGGATAFTSGEATFNVSVNKVGTGYQLVPALSSGTLPGANQNSAAFTITAGTATQLVFTLSPGNTRAGAAFASQPVVEARDALGNIATGFSGAVTLVIKSGTGTAGATLGGTLTANAVNGVASFSGLNIDKVGVGYVLTASSAGPLTVDSSTFNITATGLAFTLQPVTTPAGQVFVVKVAAQDASNNPDTTFTGAVTLAIKFGTGSPRATLGGTVTVNAVNGVADFTGQGLNIVKAASGYILMASASGLAGAESQPFDITSGTATQLVVTTSPSNTAAGAPLTLAVEVRDAFDNLATSYSGVVDLTIATNPGGGTLGGTSSKAFSGGIANFGVAEGANINKIGVGYTLHVASGALTADSAAFNITASRLVFAASPGTTPVGAAFVQQPVLRAEDSFGTLDTTFTGPVTLTILSGTGTSGATLNGTVALAATGGVATFSRLAIDRIGTGYQLSAAAAGLPSVTSSSFDITKAVLYVPLMRTPGYPDLVARFSLSTSAIVEHKPVIVTVTITNQGNTPADPFWVDFYVNPSAPPTAANQPWDKSCGGRRCEQGIAWYVDKALAPGESITLTSTPGSYYAKNTVWDGSFNTGLLNLYLYADSWNPGVLTGAVYESNETNNRAEFHTQPALAGAMARTAAPPPADLPALPPRPARPGPER